MGVDYEQMRYQVAGINHMAWFLDLSLNGVDLYPRLENCLEEPETVKKDPVRFEIFKQFGRFVTESSRHMAEYVPYFMRSDVEVERLDIPVSWLEKVEKFRQARAIRNQKMTTDPSIEIRRSNEYAARIIHAIETDTPAYIYGNVLNTGLVSNLPNGCCVEVPCLVNRAGLQPCYIGDLPPQCAALCRTNVNTQELTVRAILEKNRDYIYHAAMLDPNTSAQMTLPQIRTTMDQLLDAQKHLIEV
ncbi:TPA: hypothetical protein EYO57_19300 [Candidatus Poribacteria bacterium]|nr:hypothetical protein [Candidatus Poribacteria bacterium]HIO46734.1 hypothetical protein [Candidatus Poribacteria bacterium]